MFDYIRDYYLQTMYGPSYLTTNLFLLAGIVLIFNDRKLQRDNIIRLLLRFLGLWAVDVILATIYYQLIGGRNLDFVIQAVVLVLAMIVFRTYECTLRLVRGIVYLSAYLQVLVLSEFVGDILRILLGEDKRWLEHSTWVVVLLLLAFTTFFINYWTVEDMKYVSAVNVYIIISVAAMGMVLQYMGFFVMMNWYYRIISTLCFYVLMIISYYSFYLIARESRHSIEAMELAHKEQLDKELILANQENMEHMHALRHELKNHMAYIRVLVAEGDYERLFEYTNQVLNENEKFFRSVATGNSVVDAVVSRAIQKAEKKEVRFDAQIIVPKELPFVETDFCSILSNLTDNAIEAAEKSGEEEPVIHMQILPKQDYLFIHIDNPFDLNLSSRRVLSLRTTKSDSRFHGYGTKVIRMFAEKYNGSLNYDIRENRFIADVMLDLYSEGE